MRPFTFDFKALYDNLNPDIVKKAVEHAIMTIYPVWSSKKRKWILDLIDVSLRASVGKYKGKFYVQKKGVPTGGSLCVQLANIAVYYIMNEAVYSKPALMNNVRQAKRYIDDGGGFYAGSQRSFNSWMKHVNEALQPYGLYIDEHMIKNTGEFVPFLDIQFGFNTEGELQTDLFVKPTDSRSYLHFSSAHPNHTFAGIVYSQCLRLRRIINNKERLQCRIDELVAAFTKSGYPKEMLLNISKKVINLERNVNEQHGDAEPVSKSDILVVSCFGTDTKLTSTLKKHQNSLLQTNCFKNSAKPLFRFVKRTAANVGSKLAVLKSITLDDQSGETRPCNGHVS